MLPAVADVLVKLKKQPQDQQLGAAMAQLANRMHRHIDVSGIRTGENIAVLLGRRLWHDAPASASTRAEIAAQTSPMC
jgi:hypothetical protein